ncbi:hypothetical protein HP15_917 [Marinobacter adhaerens HP15]|uniref:Uncharacterized protein n=1 Tax=Marinobacter adhaerens (strain DSM 23420 / HP15) TaxID=225937 RepID=E4PEX6_MARAH|nr:hypothetical protein HP15_917 [Marinobacter adhaerens HP15]
MGVWIYQTISFPRCAGFIMEEQLKIVSRQVRASAR